MSQVRRILGAIWFRGFAPAPFVFFLGLFSIGSWIVLQGSGPTPLRGVLGHGVLMVCWENIPNPYRGIGRGGGWDLGVFIDPRTSAPIPKWYCKPGLWSLKGARLDWDLQVHPGCVKIPLLPLAVLLAIPPSIAAYVRSRRLQAWQCQSCGYDLRATTGPCPECGQTRKSTQDLASANR
jgi:hypothetical protein